MLTDGISNTPAEDTSLFASVLSEFDATEHDFEELIDALKAVVEDEHDYAKLKIFSQQHVKDPDANEVTTEAILGAIQELRGMYDANTAMASTPADV